MPRSPTMSLALLFGAAGSHSASWMHPVGRPPNPMLPDAYAEAALLCERGLFDRFFIADTSAAWT